MVVGHYMGKGLPWETTPYLTEGIKEDNKTCFCLIKKAFNLYCRDC